MNCPYCKRPATFGPNEGFYGRRYVSAAGSYKAWYCLRDRAYVGVHHNDPSRPLGTMANSELRRWRTLAHRTIDPLWKSGKMSRSTLYRRLEKGLGRPIHVGESDIEQCKSIIYAAQFL